jgi:hypothetical protein
MTVDSKASNDSKGDGTMIKLSKKAEALLPALLKKSRDALLQEARLKGMPLSGDYTHEEVARLLADAYSRVQKQPAPKATPRYKDEDFYQGEALHSKSRNGLVRFVRWLPNGMAQVSDLVLSPLPDALPADDLVRPSTMPDAQWAQEIPIPVAERGKVRNST